MSAVVLLVDDDDCFALLLPRILRNAQVEVSLQYVGDGEQAIHYLCGDGAYGDREHFPFPSLILLDLKMPRINGFEFLEWKQHHPDLKSLPVVVWSSSALPEDMTRAMASGALSYIVKPIEMEQMADVFKWLEPFLNAIPLPMVFPKEAKHFPLKNEAVG